jgi:hypothetical protein
MADVIIVRYCHYVMRLENGRLVFEYGIEVLEEKEEEIKIPVDSPISL